MTRKLYVLDLFSGIGGFSLGLERAGFQTAAFCEINPFCRHILKKRWPGIPVFKDIRQLDTTTLARAGLSPINVICGGFPCQDISSAGKGAGLAGKRSGLWSHFARLISEIKPEYIVIENVSMLRRRGLETVLNDLNAMHYDAEWHCIPASGLGALHQRDRLWIIAWPRRSPHIPLPLDIVPGGQWKKPHRFPAILTGSAGAHWKDKIMACGNAVVPQIPHLLGYAIQKHKIISQRM